MSSLSLFVSDKNLIVDIRETLKLIDENLLNHLNLGYFDQEKLLHLNSLKNLQALFSKNINSIIDRVYFGVETCEWKIPSLDSTEKAYKLIKKNNLYFTYVTPYVGSRTINKLDSILFFLNELDENVEVVINDWGVLNIIEQKYINLIPVLGRLLVKMKRDPRYSLKPYYEKYFHEEERLNCADDAVLESNIKKYLGDCSISMPIFQTFLNQKRFSRISLDLISSDFYIKSIFPVDVYWPWTYVTSGRGCIQCYGSQHILNQCSRSCRNEYYEIEGNSFKTFFKGNAIWMYTPIEFLSKYLTINNIDTHPQDIPISDNNVFFDRIIYQPYIPA